MKITATGVVIVLKITEVQTEQVQLPDRNVLPAGVRSAIRHMLLFLSGLLFSSLQLTGSFSPFGVAFLAAVPTRYIFSTGAGAAAGYLLTLDSVSALRYVAALLSAGVLSKLVRQFERLQKIRFLPSCIAFLVCFLTGMALLVAEDFTLHSFFLYLGEASAAFLLSYFFSSALLSARTLLETDKLSPRAIPGICITAFLLLLSVSDIALFRISFARIAALYLILLFSWLYRETGGAIAGLAAAGAFLCDPAVGFSAFAYAAAGLFAGVFSHTKRLFAALVLLGTFAVAFLFSGGDTSAVYLPIEAAFAAGFFLLTPASLLQRAARTAAQTVMSSEDNPRRQAFLGQLDSATAAVEEMSQSVKKVSAYLRHTAQPAEKAWMLRTKEEVCAGCGRNGFCWEKHAGDTLHAFEQTAAGLRGNVVLREATLPPTLQTRCIRQTSLVESFNRNAVRMAERSAAQLKIDEIRQTTAEQFDGLVDILHEFAAEAGSEQCFDETAAKRVTDGLRNTFSLDASNVLCSYNADGKLRLTMDLPREGAPDKANLRQCLETALGRDLELPEAEETEAGTHVTFCERTAFRVEAAAAKITADNEKLCGDSYESFYDGRGNYVVILSDGMGQGTRAALDSTLAVTLTAKLIKSGIGYHSALKMVNAALMLKSGDESLATLDVLQIDLYSGKATFYKAGAAKSLIRRKNKCLEIKRASLPAGILRDVRFAVSEGQLSGGDLVVMASDGVFDCAEAPFKRALAALGGESCAAAAQKLAQSAKKKNASPHCDDITVIALKIGKNSGY